jgi:hypothetical protein
MADTRALLIFNEADTQQAQKIADELSTTHHINNSTNNSTWELNLYKYPSTGAPYSPSDGYKYAQEYDWFILVRTPRSLADQNIDMIVQAALTATTSSQPQSRLQNILAVGDPVSVQSPKWPTIRTYDMSGSTKAKPEAIKQLHNSLIPVAQPKRGGTGRLPPEDAIPYQQGQYPGNGSRQPATLTSRLIYALSIFIVCVLVIGIVIAVKYDISQGSIPVGSQSKPSAALATQQGTHNSKPKTQPTLVPTLSPEDALFQDVTTKPAGFVNAFTSASIQKSTFGWDTNDTCSFKQDGYHVISTKYNEYAPCMERQANYQNFAYQIQLNLNSGDVAGLILRADNQLSHFYRVSFSSDGTYNLISCTTNCSSPFNVSQGKTVNPKPATGPAGASPLLTVIAQKNQFHLYINHIFVLTVSDDSIPDTGNIGLYAASTIPGLSTEAVFSNLRIWTLK